MRTSVTSVWPPAAAQRRARPVRKKGHLLPWLLISGGLATALLAFLVVFGVIAALMLAPDKIPAGVKVAGIPVSGQSFEAASAALQAQFADPIVTATDGERQWPLRLADLGVTIDLDVTLDALEQAEAGANITPFYTIDLNQAQTGLVALSEHTNIAAMPGDPPQYGRAMEIPVMLDRLRLDVTGELADGVFDLSMIEVEPPAQEAAPAASTWTGEKTTHIVEAGQELGLIAREYGVDMQDIIALNNLANPDLLYVGQALIIPAAGVYVPENIPPAPSSTGKSLLVSISDQRIYAYENGQMVRTHLVSTGRTETPTVLGDYHVYVKYVADDMSGPDYFLPQVPYTMYFYQGYAVHGTYWHNSFGRPMSHGCVNLPVSEAEWFFNFAEVGTLVRVV